MVSVAHKNQQKLNSVQGEENHPHYESVRRVERADNNSPQSPNPTSTTSSLSDPADRTISLSEYSAEPLSQLQQARPSLSAEELHEFLEKSRNQLDATFAQIINTDRERSSSVSSASRRSSSSKRSREDDEESDRVAKRQVRRISLRNRTRAFVSYTTPASSLRGTEISFNIRIDTPPSTPTKAEASQGSGAVEEKKEPEAERHMEDKEGKKGKEDKEKGRAKEAEEGEEGGAEHGRGRTKSRGKTA